jgi:hypothetical protein
MAILARRFTIITLVMVIFAMMFASAAHKNNVLRRPYLSGKLFVCVNGNEPICNISDMQKVSK